MKTTKKILCLCLVLLLLNPMGIFASNYLNEPTRTTSGTRLTKSTGNIGPRSVSACIFCYYYNGELSLDSFEDISDFTVSIIDESNGQTAVFYLSGVEDTIDITLSTGSYRIELRTFDGQLYEGTLTISE